MGQGQAGNELGEKDLTEEACGHIKGVQTGPTQGRDQIFNKVRENNSNKWKDRNETKQKKKL